ncbi:MAG: hypothetical protein EOP09_16480 [Proteobacteria bacterium]|nr:MAG: hypothetical protein EOP09_16480 [Pseudomonadota bacterium]
MTKNRLPKIFLLSLASGFLASCALITEKPEVRETHPYTSNDAIRAQDLIVGMRADDVLRSWGNPTHVEEPSSAQASTEERWVYRFGPQHRAFESVMPERIVYFRSGRVIGWETQ